MCARRLGRERVNQARPVPTPGRGLVNRLTTTVTTKLMLKAKIAPQKFCAMSLG